MIQAVVLTVVAGVFLFRFVKFIFEQSKQTPEQLYLGSVVDAVMEKQHWSRERAEAARDEYVRFLTLLQLKPGFMVIPWLTADGQDDLDQFWHQHILDTAKYADDCRALFGKMLHHNPHVKRGSEQEAQAVEKTQRLYARTFGRKSDGSVAEPIFLASCSSCAAVTSCGSGHGHGHGDSGGSGHSDGGHSCGGGHGCGGHGCGGHGCGSGCGGH